MSGSPTLNQVHFRFRSDANDANTGTPTWIGAEDANVTFPLDTNFRVRIVVQNTGTGSSLGNLTVKYSKNGGAYTTINTSSLNCRSADASSSADAATIATANFKLTAGAGSATAGVYDENGNTSASIAAGVYREDEFGLILRSADMADGDTIDLRVYDGSSGAFTSYSVSARITAGSGFTWLQMANEPPPHVTRKAEMVGY